MTKLGGILLRTSLEGAVQVDTGKAGDVSFATPIHLTSSSQPAHKRLQLLTARDGLDMLGYEVLERHQNGDRLVY